MSRSTRLRPVKCGNSRASTAKIVWSSASDTFSLPHLSTPPHTSSMASRKGSRPPGRRRPYDSNNDRDRHPQRTFDSRSQPGIVPTPHCNRCVLMGTTSDCDYRQKFHAGMGSCTRCFTADKLCHNSNEHRRQHETPRDTLNATADRRGTEQRRGRDANEASKGPQEDRSRRRADRPHPRSLFRRSRSPSYRNRDRSTSRRRNRDYDSVRSTEVPDAARGHVGNDKDQQVCRFHPRGTCRQGERCMSEHIGPAPANSASHDADRTAATAPEDTHGDTRTSTHLTFQSATSSDLWNSAKNKIMRRLELSEDEFQVMFLGNRVRAPDDSPAQPQGHLQLGQSLQPRQSLAPRQHMPMVGSEPLPDHIVTQQYAQPEQHARTGQYVMPHQYSAEQEQPLWQNAMPQAQGELQRHSIGQEQPHPNSALHYGGTANHHLSPRVHRSPDLDDRESTPIKREDDDDIWAVNE